MDRPRRRKLRLRLEAYNVLNRTRYDNTF